MNAPKTRQAQEDAEIQDEVFDSAARLFALLSTPMRLKIISAVCEKERNVSELLELIQTTQPNMSQHLATLHQRGVLSKRREGVQIYYKLQSERVAMLCRAVCTQIAIEMDEPPKAGDTGRLTPASQP